MDPYRSLCEADAKMLLKLELQDAIADTDDAIARLVSESRRATGSERFAILERQRGLIASKAALVGELAADRFYVPRAARRQPRAG